MDRSVLEGNPHQIIEGMIIGAYGTGATEGIVYVRNEYPLAIKHLSDRPSPGRSARTLGRKYPGITDSPFTSVWSRGLAPLSAVRKRPSSDRLRERWGNPGNVLPSLSRKGIDQKPTVINNVETWANIPLIIGGGAQSFSKIGTAKSTGTKIFSLVGKIKNTGLVEVPMGITIEEIVNEIGGGPVNGTKMKAVQTGGPSGGCIPARMFHLPIDYESLTQAGSIMGSGGMIVMDEHTCMVDVAKYFMNFLKDESCGKCFTCRKGTQRMYEILDDISSGKGTTEQLCLLEGVGPCGEGHGHVWSGSDCGQPRAFHPSLLS